MEKLLNRLWSTLIEEVFTNWRLVLLGLTGLALSLASGWTTWDGMTNFTGNPVLSMLITFGIQGVMLIAAWLIGETFALGLRGNGEGTSGGVFWGLFVFLSVVVFAIFAALMSGDDPSRLGRSIYDFGESWSNSLAGLILVVVVLGVLIYGFTQKEIIGPYIRGGKIIIQNLPIWLMFLACLATSVFFSFDSLFSTIFPPDERKRAGDIRAQNQVSGVLADVETLLKKRQVQARSDLFKNASWKKYDAALDLVQNETRRAPDLVLAERKKRLVARQLEVQRFREQQSTAEGRFRNLKAEKDRRLEIIDRLEKLRPPIVVEIDGLQSDLQAKRKALIAARADAKAEARGVGNSQQAGRGPKYRALAKVVTKLSIEEELITEQLKGVHGNLGKLDGQLRSARREAEAFSTQIASYGSQAEAAKTMLEAGKEEEKQTGEAVGSISADAFERTRSAFRQAPTQAKFALLQRQCSSLLTVLTTVPQLEKTLSVVDCEPKDANALAARVFVLNQSVTSYKTRCGKAASAKFGDVDALLKHGQSCVLLSGLSGADSEEYRSKFNRIELNRDDKAHRFVVSWNAFLDGNRLAYLAITIALAIDGLVFMSGLFGANSLKTPLAEGSGAEGRTAAQLDALMESALLPDKLFSADVVLNALRPSNREGFAQKVVMSDLDPDEARIVRNVINAGSVIGLVVEDDGNSEIYLIRRQLFEKISHIRQREIRLTNTIESHAGLRKSLEAALLPEQEMLANISRVKQLMHPSDLREGFGLEVDLNGVDGDTSERVRRVLTAGASHEVVKPHPKIPRKGFLIKNDFAHVLLAIREAMLKSYGPEGGRPMDVGIYFDEGLVKQQLSDERVKALAAPVASTSSNLGVPEIVRRDAEDIEHDESMADRYEDMRADIRAQFKARLELSFVEFEDLDREVFRKVAAELDSVLRPIEKSIGQIRMRVDGCESTLRGQIRDCRQELLEKYRSHGNIERYIRDVADFLGELMPLFVLRNGGAYQQAIEESIRELQGAVESGRSDAEFWLDQLLMHAQELHVIERDFSENAEWDKLKLSMVNFQNSINRPDGGSSDQTAGQHLN